MRRDLNIRSSQTCNNIGPHKPHPPAPRPAEVLPKSSSMQQPHRSVSAWFPARRRGVGVVQAKPQAVAHQYVRKKRGLRERPQAPLFSVAGGPRVVFTRSKDLVWPLELLGGEILPCLSLCALAGMSRNNGAIGVCATTYRTAIHERKKKNT